MSFDNMGNLVVDTFGSLAKIELQLVNDSNILSEELKDQLNKTEQKLDLPPELEIQKDAEKYQEGEKKLPLEPVSTSTPLQTNQINKIYDEEKENYLETTMTINKTDIDTAVDIAQESNEEVINDITNPTPGLIVDNALNADDSQFEYKSNDLEKNFNLSNQL